MKKFYLIPLLMAALTANAWQSAGDGTTYTLATIADAGDHLTADGDKYLMTSDITIAEGDILHIAEGDALRVGEGCRLTILGSADIRDARISTDPEAPGVSVLVDGAGVATFTGVEFDGLGILTMSTQGITIEGCSFANMLSAANSQGAIAFMGQSRGTTIQDCDFADCRVPAIGCAGNAYCGMLVKDCTFTDCNQENTNKPMLNITQPGANGPTVISGCTINGAQRNMVGGISVSDLVSGETGDVVIEGNTVRDCRYGINVMGPMNAEVRGNVLVDNRYESNAMNGGSGISATAYSGRMSLVISGNEISGNMWGVTLISYGYLFPAYYQGFAMVSLGQPDNADIDSPGLNTFADNGNDGTAYDASQPCDLYNNTDMLVYAQNNTWGGDPATVIVDSADDAALGQVIYEPVHDGIGRPGALALRYDATSATVISPVVGDIEVYALDGKRVLRRTDCQLVSVASLAPGLYLARTPAGAIKFKR